MAPCGRTVVVLGSGGHTAEMLCLLKSMRLQKYPPRSYIAAVTDALSGKKAIAAEQLRPSPAAEAYEVRHIPRSREVGQSYVTSIWTTLVAVWAALSLIWTLQPELVLVNGPGTCIPICFATIVYRSIGRCTGKIIFVESIARVNTLSLSGKLLYHGNLADAFFVQWPKLQQKYPGTRYGGRLL